jgi:hypothetical protein
MVLHDWCRAFFFDVVIGVHRLSHLYIISTIGAHLSSHLNDLLMIGALVGGL